MTSFRVRRATHGDVDVLQALCSLATGAPRTLCNVRGDRLDPAKWLAAQTPVFVVGERDSPIGFGAVLSDAIPLGVPRCAELAIFVSAECRRRGAARAAMQEILATCRAMGLWKLVAYAWPEDAAARALLDRSDFREVGTMVKHVNVDSGWRDVLIYERLVLAARRTLPSIPGT